MDSHIRRVLIWIPVVAVTALGIAGCAVNGGQDGPSSPTASPDAAETTPPPRPTPAAAPPQPDPDGRVTGRCDTLLDSDLRIGQDGRYKFIATLEAENTGNIGIEVEVWAEFELLGAEPLRYTEQIEVPVGETVTVYVDESVIRSEWSRHNDAGRSCDIGIELVGLFGEVES